MSRVRILRTLQIAALIFPAFGARAQDFECLFRDAASPAPSLAYVVCDKGSVLMTTDGGATWKSADTGGKHLRTIAFLDSRHGFIAGDSGTLLVTEDGGAHWQARDSGITDDLLDIAVAGKSAWISGEEGTILYSGDGGRTWAKQTTGIRQGLEAVAFTDESHGCAVGWVGIILCTSDGGKKWDLMKAPAASWSLSSVYFVDAKNGWVVGFGGQILHTTDGGATWDAQKSPVESWLTSVAMDSSGHGWITTGDGFLTTTDGGANWKFQELEGQIYPDRLVQGKNELWAIGDFGVLRQSGNNAKWQVVRDGSVTGAIPKIPDLPGDAPAADNTGEVGKPTPAVKAER
jgi:photosystem II stability/assembly factor-like uncharacterized protein